MTEWQTPNPGPWQQDSAHAPTAGSAAVLSLVPFVDVLNTMLDASLPLTVTEYDEWGNPNDKEYYDYILSYSPYDQLEARDYPPMLVTAGLNDPRVTYWEPAKYVAKLRHLKTDDNLLLLKTNMGAGHRGQGLRPAAVHQGHAGARGSGARRGALPMNTQGSPLHAVPEVATEKQTIGLAVLMSYHGVPVPAEAGTTIPAIEALWCHIGDEQDVAADLSTFSGAMAAKACQARFAAMVTRSVPTDLATHVAGAWGLTLVGRARREQPLYVWPLEQSDR